MQKKCCMVALFLFIVLLSSILSSQTVKDTRARPSKPNPQSVLILNSYHKGYPWTDELVTTIARELLHVFPKLQVRVEYMDSKRIHTQQYLNLFLKLLKEKYGGARPDMAIVTDDNAFKFSLRHYDDLFQGVPVVFVGVNRFESEMIRGREGQITGIVQYADIGDTLDLALRLHPSTRHVVIIHDGTPTGLAYRRQAESVETRFRGLNFSYLSGKELTTKEMLSRLRGLARNSVAMLCIWVKGKEGVYIPWAEIYPKITQASPVPVYGVLDDMLSYGVVGGKLQSAKYHGKAAAQLALRILKGEDVKDIPVTLVSPNKYMFDYRQLQKWGIPESSLPEGSLIIHKPISFYQSHKKWVWSGLILFLLMGVVILLMAANIRIKNKAQKALQASERKYRTLFDDSQDAIFVANKDSAFLDVNYATLDLLGRSREEIQDLKLWDVFVNAHECRLLLDRITEDGKAKNYEAKIKGKDGQIFDCLITISALNDGTDNLVGYHGIFHDITELKETMEALRQSERNFRDLFENVSDLVYQHDFEGRFLKVNAPGHKALGYKEGELVGKKITEIMKPEFQGAYEKEYLPTIKEKGFFHGTTVFLAKDGRERYIEFRNGVVRPAYGDPYVAGIGRDVTEKILQAKEMKKLQAQLIQAQRMEAVGTLAGGVAHDFNNLLQAIMGYIQILLMDKDSKHPDIEPLQAIKKTAQRGAELVQQLFAFSRKAETSPRPLNLNEEVLEAEKLLKRTIPKMIDIELSLDEHLKLTNADPVQIGQVIMNLAINARDAMPNGGKIIIKTANTTLDQDYCKTHIGATPGQYVLLSVTDTGKGMDSETVQHIFDPFFTTKEPGKGTGLGLAMVYGIVKSHRGYITCSSEQDAGTTFKIYLPAI